MVVFKMRESVPTARYSPVCNVLRQWKTSLILTYRVYRLYDYVFSIIYYYIYIYFFLPFLCNIFVVVCCKVWILGVWGELACHERLFNPPLQFSRLDHLVSKLFCTTFLYKCFVVSCMYLDGGMGGRRVATYFFPFFSILLSILLG